LNNGFSTDQPWDINKLLYLLRTSFYLAVGLRRGARGPLNRKPSIGRVESLGEASKIVRIPQSSNRDYPSLGAGGRGATFVGRLWTAFTRRTWSGPGGSNLSLDVQRLRGCGYE
jgi:hypothetical protein